MTGAPRRKPTPWEDREQRALVTWFDRQYPRLANLLQATPNGGKRNRITAATMKATGTRAGVPDLFLAIPPGLWIELKVTEDKALGRKRGRLSDVQKEMIAQLRAAGWRVEVCYGWQAAQAVIKDFMQQTHASVPCLSARGGRVLFNLEDSK